MNEHRRSLGQVVDRSAFEKMRRIVPTRLASRRPAPEGRPAGPLPEEVAFKLTNQCNLRCAHCYQWNDGGYHHELTRDERRQHLPISIVSDVFEATRDLRSNIYLWGGEPLLYRHWDDLVELLIRDPRWTSICTNGLLIEDRIDSLTRISTRLEMDIAVDGLESHHDNLRGRGAFGKTLKAIEALLELRRKGEFNGEITINCVITDALVPDIFDVVRFWERMAVDTVYLSLPWYLSRSAASSMDRYVERHEPWDRGSPQHVVSGSASWYSYSYRMNPELVEPLLAQLDRVNHTRWTIKVRYNPAVDPGEMTGFISGSAQPAGGKTRCLAILSRMDIAPNGDVLSCKFYPESSVGNLHRDTISSVWLGSRFRNLRSTIDRCGLMPVCSKCSLLYSRGV